ncbi:hypothetical protein Tco_0835916 [Tanacetum coccineum]
MLKYTEKLNEQAKLEKLNEKVKLEESNARFDKWKESSKNLVKLINSSMSSRSKFGLEFRDTFGSDEDFAFCVSRVKSSSSKTNEPLTSTPSSVDFKTMSKTAV